MSRKAQYPIADFILNRWSPRAMSGQELSDKELMPLFEAARWAPSSYNNQPWRFIYAKRNTPAWQPFFDLLVSANQVWAKNAGVLIVVISYNKFDYNGKPSRTHSFDAGSAWENLALQGHMNGLVIHGMEGFDYERAQKELHVPHDYTVEAMIAVGKPASADILPPKLVASEKQSDRKSLVDIIFEGTFKVNNNE